MTTRQILLGIFTIVVLPLLVWFFYLNMDYLFESQGWNTVLSGWLERAKAMQPQDWFFLLFIFAAGGFVALLINYFLPSDSGSHLDCSESIKIMDFQIDRNALQERNPRLLFWMIAYNGTTKEISKNDATGSFFYQGDYHGEIECEIKNEPIPSGETFMITIHQWVSQEDAQQIIDASQENNHISFGFNRMNVSLKCHKRIINLLIPDSLQFHIKQDWRVQPNDEFFRPTWQDKQ